VRFSLRTSKRGFLESIMCIFYITCLLSNELRDSPPTPAALSLSFSSLFYSPTPIFLPDSGAQSDISLLTLLMNYSQAV